MIIYCMAKEGRDWEKCFPNFLIQYKTLTQLNVGVWGNAPKRNLLPRTFYLDHVDKTCSHWTKYVPCAEVPFPCIPKCCFPPAGKCASAEFTVITHNNVLLCIFAEHAPRRWWFWFSPIQDSKHVSRGSNHEFLLCLVVFLHRRTTRNPPMTISACSCNNESKALLWQSFNFLLSCLACCYVPQDSKWSRICTPV